MLSESMRGKQEHDNERDEEERGDKQRHEEIWENGRKTKRQEKTLVKQNNQ